MNKRTQQRPNLAGVLLRGSAKGVLATAAMSAFLLVAQRRGAVRKQPPRIIVESLLPKLAPDQVRPLTVVAHFGYGAAGGAAYTLLRRWLPHILMNRTLFGLALWAAGYEWWLPRLGILPPAHRDSKPRAATMLVAHVIYGLTLGAGSTDRTAQEPTSASTA